LRGPHHVDNVEEAELLARLHPVLITILPEAYQLLDLDLRLHDCPTVPPDAAAIFEFALAVKTVIDTLKAVRLLIVKIPPTRRLV